MELLKRRRELLINALEALHQYRNITAQVCLYRRRLTFEVATIQVASFQGWICTLNPIRTGVDLYSKPNTYRGGGWICL